jgi:hypothetical protein
MHRDENAQNQLKIKWCILSYSSVRWPCSGPGQRLCTVGHNDTKTHEELTYRSTVTSHLTIFVPFEYTSSGIIVSSIICISTWRLCPQWRLLLDLLPKSPCRPLSSSPPAAMVAGGEWEGRPVPISFRFFLD